MPDGVAAHDQRRTLQSLVHFPAHEPRTESATFRATKHHLVHVLKTPCWIGGATIDDIKNGLPDGHRCHGATQLEVHHDLAEWAEWNGLDWRKVAADFPQLGIHDDESFRKAAEQEGSVTVLCNIHHRARYHGIHMTDYPTWKADRHAKDGFEFIPDPQ